MSDVRKPHRDRVGVELAVAEMRMVAGRLHAMADEAEAGRNAVHIDVPGFRALADYVDKWARCVGQTCEYVPILTPCRVCRKQGEKEKALLTGFYEEAWTHGASISVGGFPAGQVARPVAVVLLESGNVETVNAGDVTIDGVEGLFEQYAWMDGEGE